jgi:hypothetical protein
MTFICYCIRIWACSVSKLALGALMMRATVDQGNADKTINTPGAINSLLTVLPTVLPLGL